MSCKAKNICINFNYPKDLVYLKSTKINFIKEDLLHYIWKTKSFNQESLTTTSDQKITLLHIGHHNHNAGPDFLDARISVDGTVWAGHVELHIKASDWLKHQHGNDKGYQNVILHVVMYADVPILLQDNTMIPCLELKDRISHFMIGKYHYLQNNKNWIPCEELIGTIPMIIKETTKSRALAERLTNKALELQKHLIEVNQDLNELIYRRLAWSFGLQVNSDAMMSLACSLPYRVLQKHKDQIFQIEALLFGQSSLIDKDFIHPYVQGLAKEYKVLKAKFKLLPIQTVQWKYSRLRPAGFPTLRVAQFARFIFETKRLDDFIFNADFKSIQEALDVELSGYWANHYRFGVPSVRKNKRIGAQTRMIIIINAVIPILFMYGMIRKNNRFKNKAIQMLEEIKPELNSITKRWETLDMINKNAADSQALLQLKKFHCDKHQCLSCPIGHKVIVS